MKAVMGKNKSGKHRQLMETVIGKYKRGNLEKKRQGKIGFCLANLCQLRQRTSLLKACELERVQPLECQTNQGEILVSQKSNLIRKIVACSFFLVIVLCVKEQQLLSIIKLVVCRACQILNGMILEQVQFLKMKRIDLVKDEIKSDYLPGDSRNKRTYQFSHVEDKVILK